MKLVLASYFQPDNHGTGRKLGISPSKPDSVESDGVFEPLSPGQLYWDYHYEKNFKAEEAGETFVTKFTEQCNSFVKDVIKQAESSGKTPQELLPFSDGDTLLSWELEGHLTYRRIVANALRELGYEVEEK